MKRILLFIVFMSPYGLCLIPFRNKRPLINSQGLRRDGNHWNDHSAAALQARMASLGPDPHRIPSSVDNGKGNSKLPPWTRRPRPLVSPQFTPPAGIANRHSYLRPGMHLRRRNGFLGPPKEVLEVLPGAISKVRSTYSRPQKTTSTTTTTEPPVIWFPNQHEECEQESGGGGGFSTFSLLALVMSATNLVGILANNANNNLNNNNNNDNLNNNNVLDGNENNANNNVDLLTMVTFGGGKKRRRRDVNKANDILPDISDFSNVTLVGVKASGEDSGAGPEEEEEEAYDTNLNSPSSSGTSGDGFSQCWQDDGEGVTAEEISAVVSILFLRGRLQAQITDNFSCLCRSLCIANVEATDWGDVGLVMAELLSEVSLEWITQRGLDKIKVAQYLEAGRDGRDVNSSAKECHVKYQCPREIWNILSDDEAVMQIFMKPTNAW